MNEFIAVEHSEYYQLPDAEHVLAPSTGIITGNE